MRYLLLSPNKRPRNINKEIKKELINYIKNEIKKKHFPSRREMEKKFRLRLDSYFKNIDYLYKEAGTKYKLHANQNLKAIKAKLLLELILKNLNKFGLELISSREIRERGIDILTKKENERVGIELKAYNKEEKLKVRDIKQVKRFIENEGLNKAIIITTTDKNDKNFDIPNNIFILNYSKLLRVLKENNKELSFIRNYSVNREDISKKIKRQNILDYVLRKYKKEKVKPNYNNILKELHLDLYSYFQNLSEIYKALQIPPPLKNLGVKKGKNLDKESAELWKNEFKKYILKEIKEKKKYPSGIQIAKAFRISHIWNIVKMSELYGELNLKPYLERKKRTTFV